MARDRRARDHQGLIPARSTDPPTARRRTARMRPLNARSDTVRDSIIAPTIDATSANT